MRDLERLLLLGLQSLEPAAARLASAYPAAAILAALAAVQTEPLGRETGGG